MLWLYGNVSNTFHFRAGLHGNGQPDSCQTSQSGCTSNDAQYGCSGLIGGNIVYQVGTDVGNKDDKDNLPNKQGTLMFWFKATPDLKDWTTVFSARTYVQPTSIFNLPQASTSPPPLDSNYQTAQNNYNGYVAGTNPAVQYIPLNFNKDAADPATAAVNGAIYQNSSGQVCFYNKVNNHVYNYGTPFIAIETTIQMKYDESNKQITVRVTRQFRVMPLQFDKSQYYTFPGSLPANERGKVSQAVIGDTTNYPIRCDEWYHLAIRWQDYVDFPAPTQWLCMAIFTTIREMKKIAAKRYFLLRNGLSAKARASMT